MINLYKNEKIEMKYFEFGTGNKNMIIIPGVSVQSVMESENLIVDAYKLFNDDFKVYVFDRINNMPNYYSIFDMADDMIEVIDGLNLKDIYLFGTSQGGMIAQLIAIKRPYLIVKLNINSTTSFVNSKTIKIFDKIISLALANKLDKMLDLFCQVVYSDESYIQLKDSLNAYSKSLTKEDIERFIIECKALNGFDISDKIQCIKTKTLIICSKDDKLIDYTDSLLLNDKIKNSEIIIYENYGHVVYDEAPDIKSKIYDFFMSAI